MDKLVSIIVPVYNSENYISDCFDSLLDQTYKNIEVILIDDGSSDESGRIIDEYAKKDSRIIPIHQENSGVARTRNNGINLAKGEFIVFVDADDWLSKDAIEHLMYLQSLEDADLCYTVNIFSNINDKQVDSEVVKTISPVEATEYLLSPRHVVGCWNKIYRKEWLLSNNLYQNENLFSGEGLHYTVTVAQRANKITYSNKRIYYYRRNVSTSATTRFDLKMITNNELSLELIEKELLYHDKNVLIMLKYFNANLLITGIFSILNNGKKKEHLREYQKWRKKLWTISRNLVFHSHLNKKYKLKLVAVNFFPKFIATLSDRKRKNNFKNSV